MCKTNEKQALITKGAPLEDGTNLKRAGNVPGCARGLRAAGKRTGNAPTTGRSDLGEKSTRESQHTEFQQGSHRAELPPYHVADITTRRRCVRAGSLRRLAADD